MNIAKNIKNRFFIVILLSFFSCQSSLNFKNKLDFKINISKDNFSTDEPVILQLEITNKSNKIIGLKGDLNLGFRDDSNSNVYLLVQKDNKPIYIEKKIHYSYIKSDSILFIGKEESWKRVLDITPFYPFNLNRGTYQIQAYFLDTVMYKSNNLKFMTKIKSNIKTISIN